MRFPVWIGLFERNWKCKISFKNNLFRLLFDEAYIQVRNLFCDYFDKKCNCANTLPTLAYWWADWTCTYYSSLAICLSSHIFANYCRNN